MGDFNGWLAEVDDFAMDVYGIDMSIETAFLYQDCFDRGYNAQQTVENFISWQESL